MSSRTKQEEELFQKLLADASKLSSTKKRELGVRLGLTAHDNLARRPALTAAQVQNESGNARHHKSRTASHSDFSRVMHILPVEPAQTTKEQRRVGHLLFSRRAFDKYLDFTATRYFWACFVAGPLLGGLLHAALGPLEIGNAEGRRGYGRLAQGLLAAPTGCQMWLSMDLHILRKLKQKFVVWWLSVNIVVFYVCDAALIRFEPVHTTGSFLIMCTIVSIGYFDAFCWHIIPHWHQKRKLVYFLIAAFITFLLVKVNATKTRDGEIPYSPILFRTEFFTLGVSTLFAQAGSNVVVFMLGLLWHAWAHPKSYVLWKSRLNCIVMDSSATSSGVVDFSRRSDLGQDQGQAEGADHGVAETVKGGHPHDVGNPMLSPTPAHTPTGASPHQLL